MATRNLDQLPEHPLRTWRKAEGLTLEAAAAKVGTVKQVWFGWEGQGRRPSPKYIPLLRELTRGAITADTFFPSEELVN